jgi:hypothetical protein
MSIAPKGPSHQHSILMFIRKHYSADGDLSDKENSRWKAVAITIIALVLITLAITVIQFARS